MIKYEHMDCDDNFPTRQDRKNIDRLYGPDVYWVSRIYKYENDGMRRIFIIIYDHYSKRKTMNYAKYLLEVELDRHIRKGYIAHHKDENPLNDNIWNLEEKWESKHIKEHHKGKIHIRKYKNMKRRYKCRICGLRVYISSEFLIKKVLPKAKYYGYLCSEACYKVFCRRAKNGVANEEYQFNRK